VSIFTAAHALLLPIVFYIKPSKLEIKKKNAFLRIGGKLRNAMPSSLGELPKEIIQTQN